MSAIESHCSWPEPLLPNSEDDIAQIAEERLRKNSYFTLRNVRCTCRGGVLYLRGRLPTYYLKQLAQRTVAPVEGLTRIENQIEVAAPFCRSRPD